MNDDYPQGWAEGTLDELAEINPRHRNDLEEKRLVSFVPMPAVSEHSWKLDLKEDRPLGNVRKGYTHFADGDVLLAKITPCMENGKAAVAVNLKNGLGCGSTELHVLRPRGGIEPRFIYHYLHQDSFRREAARKFTGTAGQLRVPVSFIRETIVPLPPLPEQRRIVAKLEELLGEVDACQKRLDRIPRTLKRFRKAVLEAACEGEITKRWREQNPACRLSETLLARINSDCRDEDLPPHWISCTVGDVMYVKNGFAFRSTDYVKNGIPLIRISNIQDHVVTVDETVGLPHEKADWDFEVMTGDLLVAMSGATTGKLGVYRERARCLQNQRVGNIRIRDVKEVLPGFRNISLEVLKSRIEADAYGGAQPNISPGKIEALPFRCPPVTEQTEIVRRVERLFMLTDRIEDQYNGARVEVEMLTSSILSKAFRGELVPQDPNDEPASELLNRIKSARMTSPHAAGRRASARPTSRRRV